MMYTLPSITARSRSFKAGADLPIDKCSTGFSHYAAKSKNKTNTNPNTDGTLLDTMIYLYIMVCNIQTNDCTIMLGL